MANKKNKGRVEMMVRCFRNTSILALIGVVFVPVIAAAQDLQIGNVEIRQDPAYQSAFADLIKAADKETFDRQADRLIKEQNGDHAQLVEQLLWYAAQHEKDNKSRAFVGHLLKRLESAKQEIVMTLVPHLDNRDGNVRNVTRELLRGYEDRSATRQPDFSVYRSIIEASISEGKQPQDSLVQFMYQSDPGMGLLAMVRAMGLRKPEEIKPILWGEHVVAELFWKRQYGFMERDGVDVAAVQELEKMSQHDRWWVRLYVAEIIKENRELATPSIINRLTIDANLLVRQTMKEGKAVSPK